MSPFTSSLASLHLQDLLDDAAVERRARLAGQGPHPVPAWRRTLGGAFASAARTLDPGVQAGPRTASSKDKARAMAA
jgi:hypothetical protein